MTHASKTEACVSFTALNFQLFSFLLLAFLSSSFSCLYFCEVTAFPFFPFSRNSSVSGSEKPSVFLPKARTEMSLMFVFVWVDRNKFSAGETKLLSWPSL